MWPHSKKADMSPDLSGKHHQSPTDNADVVPLAEAVKVWARVAALSFGGPAGQIAVMHRIVVDEKRWIGESRFLHALNYCMLLPGPEAHQLAIYIGWLMNRTKGGLIAGALFILPGFISILGLSYLYVLFGNIAVIEGLFFGLKSAVLAVVVQSVLRIGGRALKSSAMRAIAATAFIAIFFLHVPFPCIVVGAAAIGFLGARAGLAAFRPGGTCRSDKAQGLEDRDTLLGESVPPHARANIAWSIRISVMLAALWLAPVAGLLLTAGPENLFSRIAIFFSGLAVFSFGGAYAALAYVAQEAVQHLGWLKPGEMVDGLGMAETTPGPLIMVTQFVGFLAAYRYSGMPNALMAATLAAILTTWVTLLPSFLWIFLGAPFIEKMRGNVSLAGAMSAITAAIVGVILNLAIWFAFHVVFAQLRTVSIAHLSFDVPILTSVAWPALGLSLLAAFILFRMRLSVITTLGGCAVLGIAWTLVFK